MKNLKLNTENNDGGTKKVDKQQGLVGQSSRNSRINKEMERASIDAGGEGGNHDGRQGENSQTEEGARERALAILEINTYGTDLWIDDINSIAFKHCRIDDGNGQESEVYPSRDGNSVIKLNNLSLAKDVPNFNGFVDRINSHNTIVASLPYEILGFASNEMGETCFVLKQPYVNNGEEASYEEIDDFMTENGFKNIGAGAYSNGIFTMWDVYPRNVLIDECGNFNFIDVVFEDC